MQSDTKKEWTNLKKLNNGIPINSRLYANKAQTTLDTPEHRWLAAQLNSIRQKTNRIKRQVISQNLDFEDRPERAN